MNDAHEHLQAEGAAGAAGGGAAAAGMSADVVARLQERATALTQERKRRGRTVPDGLLAPDQLRAFLTLASHPVSAFPVSQIPPGFPRTPLPFRNSLISTMHHNMHVLHMKAFLLKHFIYC